MDENQTLGQWVAAGEAMLSNYTSVWLCSLLRCNERELRTLRLADIFAVPLAGMVAKRELSRWWSLNHREGVVSGRAR